jgi:hypothetical protein
MAGELLVFFGLPQNLFDFHVSVLLGVEYLATIQTFNVFDILFTRYDAHFGVFAGGIHVGSGVGNECSSARLYPGDSACQIGFLALVTSRRIFIEAAHLFSWAGRSWCGQSPV